jgi:hypothetical protein
MKKYIIIFMVFLCCWAQQEINAQVQPFTSPTYTPITPSASELAKAISFPVNHGTGLVDIKIPLYDVVYGDITVPIYLTYHSSGIKPRQHHSVVGAGWALVAEPQISRSVEGLKDEKYYAKVASPNNLNNASQFEWLNADTYDFRPDRFFYRNCCKG